MKKTSLGAGATACVIAGAAVHAQTAPPVTLSSGFTPDPQRVTGLAGGPVDARTVNDTCRGWLPSEPNHTLIVTAGLPFLRVFVDSQTDTTLLIRAPNGQVFCNDDTFGLNPALDAAYGPGTYLVWVGTYAQGTRAPYALAFGTSHTVAPARAPAPVADSQPVDDPVAAPGLHALTGPGLANPMQPGLATSSLSTGMPVVTGLLSAEAVRRVVLRNLAQWARCDQVTLHENPQASGHVEIRMIVLGSGQVGAAHPIDPPPVLATTATCMASAARRWQFPAPAGGGIVTARIPVDLRPPR